MKTTTRILTAFLAVAALAIAQKPKSKSEIEALKAIQAEQDPAAKIKKIDDFVKKFADTEFKTILYTQAAQLAERMGDGTKVIIYSDLALETDPKAYQPMLMVSAELARSTRENDLDKDEKLAKAEKYAKEGMELAPNAPKPNPQITDAQWDEVKKEFVGDAHRDLGMIATVRKKYDVAIAEFKLAVEALAVLAKMPANPQLVPFVDKEKKRAEALKAAK